MFLFRDARVVIGALPIGLDSNANHRHRLSVPSFFTWPRIRFDQIFSVTPMSKANANFGGTVGWDEHTVIGKRAPKASELKTESALAAAARAGVQIDTSKKFAAGSNKQHEAAKNSAALDRETEELHHDRVDKDVPRAMQQARVAKEWTQADLARHVNEKQSVINEYEQGKAIPNQQVLSKLERALGVKLRGKDIGQPLSTGPKKK